MLESCIELNIQDMCCTHAILSPSSISSCRLFGGLVWLKIILSSSAFFFFYIFVYAFMKCVNLECYTRFVQGAEMKIQFSSLLNSDFYLFKLQVINFYLQLLQHRSQRQKNLPRLAVLSTFFYAKLTSPNGGGYPGVRRWTRQMKLFDQDIVLVPIHDRGMHWCLSVSEIEVKWHF
ncbi:unnamed protein product [Trichobilharzia regenti]|nr:unnamed protein product [Trichobilharzia regenti]